MQSILLQIYGALRQKPEASELDQRPQKELFATKAEKASNPPFFTAGENLSTQTMDNHGVRLNAARTKKFFSYYRNHLGVLCADLACAALVAATALALPLCANFIIKGLSSGGDQATLLSEIYSLGALMLLLVGVQALCRMFVDYRGHVMGAQMETAMRQELFEHYQKLSFSFYDHQRVGQLMSRISNDLFALSELYHHGPEDIAISLLKFIGASAILWYLDPSMTLVILVSVPFAILYALFFNHQMGVALRQGKERIAAINEHVEDSLSGIRVVRAFGGEATEIDRFKTENEHFLTTRRKGYKAEALFSVGLQTYTQLLTLLVIVFGTVLILEKSMSIADLMTFLLCIAVLIDPIARGANFARLWQEGITGFHRFMDVLEVTPDILEHPNATDVSNILGAIELRDVGFRYSSSNHDVLTHISLRIEPGEFVALVGPSGAGKSTLCSLIPRFYDVTSGDVYIDGENIKSLTLGSLRHNIGLVHQDVYLFAGTVADNIGYGKPGSSRDEIVAAAIEAQAHDFIMSLSNGYDTDIGERGVQLSGGQKQRLTIARTFLKNPPILIFDEATSALDGESERAVQEALYRIASDRTTLVIAHRLSTIIRADRIIVLTQQGIVEEGSHDVLMQKKGVYFQMHNSHASM